MLHTLDHFASPLMDLLEFTCMLLEHTWSQTRYIILNLPSVLRGITASFDLLAMIHHSKITQYNRHLACDSSVLVHIHDSIFPKSQVLYNRPCYCSLVCTDIWAYFTVCGNSPFLNLSDPNLVDTKLLWIVVLPFVTSASCR